MYPTHQPKNFERCHGEPHSHKAHGSFYRSRERRVLVFCILLTALVLICEAVGSFFSGSLSLLSDAGHMFTDLFTLLMSFFAIRLACKPVDFQKTYGYYRMEVLASLLNGFLLFGVSLWIFYEAYERFWQPSSIHTTPMLVIAGIGLFANVLGGVLLHGVRGENLNLKGAYFHVLSDTLSSVGVVLGALIIRFTGWVQIDVLLSVMIAALILFWAGKLVRDSVHILMESTPRHLNIEDVVRAIQEEVKGIREIHDVHIWEITTHMYAMTAHVTLNDRLVSECMRITESVNHILAERFHIEHVNLQYEC